jgi:hypothetical protein
MWFLRKFWVVIVTAATMVGIYYLPADTISIQEASGPWQKLLAMIDQVAALWTLSFVLLSYLGWIEVRPYIREKLNRDIFRALRIETEAVKVTVNGLDFWENTFFLLIVNVSKKSLTLKDVRAKIFTPFSEHKCSFKDGSFALDLHRGESARICLGSSITSELKARHGLNTLPRLAEEQVRSFVANERQGHKMVLVGNVCYTPIIAGKTHENPDHFFTVQLLANDTQPASFNCVVSESAGEADIYLADTTALSSQPHRPTNKIRKMTR